MPELPELEVIREMLGPRLTGRRIVDASARHPACMKTFEPALSTAIGATITGLARAGKLLCIATDRDCHICFHLMRDGSLSLVGSKTHLARNQLFVLSLDNDSDLRLTETGTERRAEVYLVTDPGNVRRIADAGIDPLGDSFTLDWLCRALSTSSRTLKRFLTDQRVITGIGNAYSDEVLHSARLSPFLLSSRMTDEQSKRLFRAIPLILLGAIEKLRDLDHLPSRKDRTFLRVHGRLGQACPACGTAVEYVSYKDSNTYYCPECQTGGRKLADRRLSRLLK